MKPEAKKMSTLNICFKMKSRQNFISLAIAFLVLISSTSGSRHHQHQHPRKLHPDHERQFLAALGLSKLPTLSKDKIEIPEVLR
jgi:hypothetical protein